MTKSQSFKPLLRLQSYTGQPASACLLTSKVHWGILPIPFNFTRSLSRSAGFPILQPSFLLHLLKSL